MVPRRTPTVYSQNSYLNNACHGALGKRVRSVNLLCTLLFQPSRDHRKNSLEVCGDAKKATSALITQAAYLPKSSAYSIIFAAAHPP